MINFQYGQTGNMRIIVSHDSVRLRNNEPYTAVSHTWGTQRGDLEGIIVPKWLSKNTLKELVEKFGPLWIDVLCIRQDDEEDKSQQIARLGDYFRQAKKVVVILADDKLKESLESLRKVTGLFLKLKEIRHWDNCFSSPDCEYVKTLKELRSNIENVSMIEWFKRVWTLQEAIIPSSSKIIFVGVNQEKVETDIIDIKEFEKFVENFDISSDINSLAWLGSSGHRCIKSLDPLRIAKLSSDLVERIRPLTVIWHRELKGREVFDARKYTFEMIRSQLGSKGRVCQEKHDLVYGIATVLEIEVKVNYHEDFIFLFYKTLIQLIDAKLLSLPDRPNSTFSWLPCLDGIPPEQAWATTKSTFFLSEVEDRHNSLVRKENHIFAKGEFLSFDSPTVVSINLEKVVSELNMIVNHIVNEGELRQVEKPELTLAILWMYRNSGSDAKVKEKELIKLIKEKDNSSLQNFLTQELENLKPILARKVNQAQQLKQDIDVKKITEEILEVTSIIMPSTNIYRNEPYYQSCNIVVVAKLGRGLLLYSTKKEVENLTHGVFYKNPSNLQKVHEKTVNILTKGENGIWCNQGTGNGWFLTIPWPQTEKKIDLGLCPTQEQLLNELKANKESNSQIVQKKDDWQQNQVQIFNSSNFTKQ